MAKVATTSTARRRATNTTNSYKNCELFTGIVVVVVLAYFPWTRRVGSLSLSRCRCRCRCHCCFALPFPQQQGTGSVRDSETDRRHATATRRLLSVSASSSASTSAPASRRVALVRSCAFCISLTLNQYFLPESFAD